MIKTLLLLPKFFRIITICVIFLLCCICCRNNGTTISQEKERISPESLMTKIPESISEETTASDYYLSYGSYVESIMSDPEIIQEYSSRKAKTLLTTFEKYIKRLEERFPKISDEEWGKADKKVAEFNNRFKEFRKEMTEDEQTNFNKIYGRFLALKAKKAGKTLEQFLKDTKAKTEGFIESFRKKAI